MTDERLIENDPTTTTVMIYQGQRVRIVVGDSDGHFDVEYGHSGTPSLRVSSDESLPDDQGRKGVLYQHYYGEDVPQMMRDVETLGD